MYKGKILFERDGQVSGELGFGEIPDEIFQKLICALIDPSKAHVDSNKELFTTMYPKKKNNHRYDKFSYLMQPKCEIIS